MIYPLRIQIAAQVRQNNHIEMRIYIYSLDSQSLSEDDSTPAVESDILSKDKEFSKYKTGEEFSVMLLCALI